MIQTQVTFIKYKENMSQHWQTQMTMEDKAQEQINVGDFVTTPEGYIGRVDGFDEEGYLVVSISMSYRVDELNK